MNGKNKKLFGKELSAILQIPNGFLPNNFKNNAPLNIKNEDKLQYIPIEILKPGNYQPRKNFEPESLQELASSIKTQGLLQPILARKANNNFEIIAGERRWRAAKMAGLTIVPVMLCETTPEGAAVIGLIENLQRQDLNPIEEAAGYKQLADEFKLTHEQIAESVGKSRTTITNMLRLLSLSQDICSMVTSGLLEMGHARALLALNANNQLDVAKIIVEKGLSVREAEKLIKNHVVNMEDGCETVIHDNPRSSISIIGWKQRLSKSLRSRVDVRINSGGQGRAVIYFDNCDELERIVTKIEKM